MLFKENYIAFTVVNGEELKSLEGCLPQRWSFLFPCSTESPLHPPLALPGFISPMLHQEAPADPRNYEQHPKANETHPNDGG